MHVHVYVTTEKYEIEIDTLDGSTALQEAVLKAKAGEGVPRPTDCRYLALIPTGNG